MFIYTEKQLSIVGIAHILKTHYVLKAGPPAILTFIPLALWGPVVEEFAFRGFLTKNKSLIVISFSSLCVALIMITHTLLFPNVLSVIWKMIISTVLIVCTYFTFHPFRFLLGNIVDKYHRILIPTISITLFTFLHIVNFDLPKLTFYQVLIFPVAFLPYFGLGVALTFLRITCGLNWSITFHIINNAMFVAVAYL